MIRQEQETKKIERKRKDDLLQAPVYSKYTQFNAVSLFIEIMIQIWMKCTDKHKHYLLGQLESLIRKQKFDANLHSADNYVPVLKEYLKTTAPLFCKAKKSKQIHKQAKLNLVKTKSIH